MNSLQYDAIQNVLINNYNLLYVNEFIEALVASFSWKINEDI
jgi:hypothetical protein